ncbi:MAG: TonB-dependent receptor, partial [Bacteroidales bacterium]
MKHISIIALLFSVSVFAQKGTVKGKVLDLKTNEPMPFTNVVVQGTTIGTTTDMDGNFIITGLDPGYITLVASFIGYESAESREILISPAKQQYVEIKIQESKTELEEVVVRRNNFVRPAESPVSLQTIGIEQIESNPGSNRDISKVIQSFPGIGSTPSFRNDILVRGGGPNESRFYLDEVEIPNINHFATQGSSGGPVGIINADFIGGVKYYSGAFPANRGNALSGVFEFNQIDGNKDKMKFRGSVGASELSLTTDGPIGKNSTFIVSARRSYLQFLFSALGLPFLPTFNDYQLKYKASIDKKNEITVVSIGALDQFALNKGIKNPTESQEYILSQIRVNEQWSYAIGTVYKHYTPNGNHTVVLSRNMLNNVAYKHPDNDESKPRIFNYTSQEIENKMRYERTLRFSSIRLNYGISSEHVKYLNDTYAQLYFNNAVNELRYNSFLELYKYGFFTQISERFLQERMILSLGVRLDGNTYNSSMQNVFNQVSPRLSASYVLTQKINLNFNTGRYYQLPAYTTLGYRDNNGVLKNKENNISYIQSDHFIAGFEYKMNRNVLFTLEGFNKLYSKSPFSVRDTIPLASKGADFGVVGDEEVISTGKGRAYGLELMNRTQLQKLNLTFSYTLVRSEYKDKKGVYIPTSWDSKHLFTSTAVYKFKRN